MRHKVETVLRFRITRVLPVHSKTIVWAWLDGRAPLLLGPSHRWPGTPNWQEPPLLPFGALYYLQL
eukprot:scaffold594537_cov38-Prasinocladus_malaysianus.AAC.1